MSQACFCNMFWLCLVAAVADQAKNLDNWCKEGLERLGLEEDTPDADEQDVEPLTEDQLDTLACQEHKVTEVKTALHEH